MSESSSTYGEKKKKKRAKKEKSHGGRDRMKEELKTHEPEKFEIYTIMEESCQINSS